MDLDQILEATEDGAKVVSEDHDLGNIRPVGPKGDPSEYAPTQAEAVRRANLDASRGRVSVVSVGEVPWHGLGVVIDRAATSEEALRLANLAGWDLIKAPMCARIEYPISELGGRTGAVDIETDRFAVVRHDTNKYLGCVAEQYKIVPNEECFSFLDSVIEGGARYETAGAIAGGRKVWMLARMPERLDVAGDEVKNYILFTTSHDGTQAMHVYPTNVRTVCANTYRMAERGRNGGCCLRHVGDMRVKIRQAQEALGLTRQRIKQFGEQAGIMARTQLEPEEYFHAVLDDVLDVTIAGQRVTKAAIDGGSVLGAIMDLDEAEKKATEEARYERAVKRRQKLFGDILERYESERNNGNARIAGTAWAAFSAVTEHADHGPVIYRGDERTRAESRFESAVYGRSDEIKQAAFRRAATC